MEKYSYYPEVYEGFGGAQSMRDIPAFVPSTVPQNMPTQKKRYRDISRMSPEDIEADINKRNGGLDPTNSGDHETIKGYLARKAYGQLDPDEEATLSRLNPKIASLMRAAPSGHLVKSGRNKAFLGGVQTGIDKQGNVHLFSFDSETADPISLRAPEGVSPTMQMQPTTVMGPGGVSTVVQTPGRGVPGKPPVTTNTGISDYKQVHKDSLDIIEDHRKLLTLESGIDKLDALIETQEKSVKDAVGYWKNTSLSNFLKPEKAKEAVVEISKIKAEVIRKNAGLTQTAAELERVEQMLASTGAYSAEAFIKAFRSLQETYAVERRMLYNRAGPVAADIASKRANVDPNSAPWETRKKNKAPASGDDELTRLRKKHLNK